MGSVGTHIVNKTFQHNANVALAGILDYFSSLVGNLFEINL